MLVAILAILIGALLTAGGAQELIAQSIFNNRLYPLIGGALGTVAGALLLSSGIALLRQTPRAIALTCAAALVSLPVFVLIGFIRPLAGWPVTIVGIAFPMFLIAYYRGARLKERRLTSASTGRARQHAFIVRGSCAPTMPCVRLLHRCKMSNVINSLILSLLLPTTCFSQQKIISRTPILRHPYYEPNVLPALKELVAERGKSKRNHFYVGRVEVLEDGYESVLVYWKENRALVLWEPGRGLNLQGVSDPRYDLRHSRRYWDLDKDVVPTLADVGGSSFLITKQDAREWIRKCVQTGERFVVNRTAQSNQRLQPTPR